MYFNPGHKLWLRPIVAIHCKYVMEINKLIKELSLTNSKVTTTNKNIASSRTTTFQTDKNKKKDQTI